MDGVCLSESNTAVLQCVITVPEKFGRGSPYQPNLDVDMNTGNIKLQNTKETTVIFDSFSSDEEVRRRNPVANSVSRLNDSSCHFPASLTLSVSSPVVAVLSPDMVSAYRTVDRKRPRPPAFMAAPKPQESTTEAKVQRRPIAKRSVIITNFDLELERHKRQCAMLFSDASDTEPPPYISMAQTLLSMKDPPTSFADALRGNPARPASPCGSESSASSWEVPHRSTSPRRNTSEESEAVSALCAFRGM
jgi:hypothetical protein